MDGSPAQSRVATDEVASEKSFRGVIEHWVTYFPYGTFEEGAAPEANAFLPLPYERSFVRFLPDKTEWTLSELMAFDGIDFVYAVTRCLASRAPTPEEVSRFKSVGFADKIDLIIELELANRDQGRNVVGNDFRRLVRARRLCSWMNRLHLSALAAPAYFLYRNRREKLRVELTGETSVRRLLFQCIDKIDTIQVKLDDQEKRGKRIVIANFCPVWPPINGGQRRVYFLARELSKCFDVEIVTLAREGVSKTLQLNPTLKEIRVVADPDFRNLEIRLHQQVPMAADLAYTLYWSHCQMYQHVLGDRLSLCDVAISAHAYSIYSIQDALKGRSIPIVHDAHNCEYEEKRTVLEGFPDKLEAIRKIEAHAIRECDVTVVCTPLDADSYSHHYGADRGTIKVVGNGVDARGVPIIEEKHLAKLVNELGIGERLVAVFGGSFYFPNFAAADTICRIAEQLPDVIFLILGGICEYPPVRDSGRKNLIRLGQIDEDQKWIAYNLADIGLNPMLEGSGTAVKMFEYAAAGLTILSTPWGTRGIPLDPDTELLVQKIEDWPEVLERHQKLPRSQRRLMGDMARKTIESTSDWSVLGEKYLSVVRELPGMR